MLVLPAAGNVSLHMVTPAILEYRMVVNVAAFAAGWEAADLTPDVDDLTREFSKGYGRTMELLVLASPLASEPTTTRPPPISLENISTSTAASPSTTSGSPASSTSSGNGCVELLVKSAGSQDGNFAEFYIDGVQVDLVSGRGLSVVVVEDSNVSEMHVFDTGFQASGSAPLAALLDGLPEGTGIMLAAMDDASDNLTLAAKSAIKGFGALQIDQLAYRSSYALIGVKGQSAVAEKLAASGDGPVQISGRNIWKPECAGTTSSAGVNSGDPLVLRVRSAGAADGNFVEFSVNGVLVDLDPGRGLSVVSLQEDGQVMEKRVFDTGFEGSGSAPLVDFLQTLPHGTIFMMAAMDDATDSLTEEAKAAIESLGGVDIRSLAYRGSYALIGVKGGPALAEGVAAAGAGPVEASRTWIPGLSAIS